MGVRALEAIYGSQSQALDKRYQTGAEQFTRVYGTAAAFVSRAPGRVNLIGEHTDYNHGFVMPVALDRDTLIFVRPRTDDMIQLANVEANFPDITFKIAGSITSAPAGDWSNYARGVAETMSGKLGRRLHGFDGLVVGAAPFGVPRGAGLSSSSSLTVAVAVALAHINDWTPSPAELAHFCSQAEWYVGTRGGIMDHFASTLGQHNSALFLDCRPDAGGDYHFYNVPLPTDYQLLIVDSGVSHRNVGNKFNHRVAACRAGVGLLNQALPDEVAFLRDVQDVAWETLAEHLPETTTLSALNDQGIDIGDLPGVGEADELRVRACCRHVWSENKRVQESVQAMQGGDVATLGRLLNEAHNSARDDYDISCDEIETLVSAARAVNGVAGARLTGAGWGGCIIALVHGDAVADFQARVSAEYLAATGMQPAIFACRAASGAGHLLPEDYLSEQHGR